MVNAKVVTPIDVIVALGEPPVPNACVNSTAIFFAASALAQKESVADCPAKVFTPSTDCFFEA